MDTNGSQDNGFGGTARTQGDQHNNDSGRGSSGGHGGSNTFQNINQKPSETTQAVTSHSTAFNDEFGPETVGVDPQTGEIHDYNPSTGQDLGRVDNYNSGPFSVYNEYNEMEPDNVINNRLSAAQAEKDASQAYSEGRYIDGIQHSLSSMWDNALASTESEMNEIGNHPVRESIDLTRNPLIKGGVTLATGGWGLLAMTAAELADTGYAYANNEISGKQAIGRVTDDVGTSLQVNGLVGIGTALEAGGALTSGNKGDFASILTGEVLKRALPAKNVTQAITKSLGIGISSEAMKVAVNNAPESEGVSTSSALGGRGANSINGGNPQRLTSGYESSTANYAQANQQALQYAQQGTVDAPQSVEASPYGVDNGYGFSDGGLGSGGLGESDYSISYNPASTQELLNAQSNPFNNQLSNMIKALQV